jgi:methionine sulfoxide reductase heme-binding subunit
VVHFWWLVKKDIREPLIFGAVLAVLLGARVMLAARKAAPSPAPAPRSQSV